LFLGPPTPPKKKQNKMHGVGDDRKTTFTQPWA
jgi:hypothetical protein